MDTSLYKNVFTFLKKAIIQPRRYNWYYLYLVLDRLNNCWGVLQPNSPKHDPCLKDTCIFIEKLNIQHWALSMKKHWPLWFKWPLQTYFWTGHIDSSIKVEMRYSSILFDHTNEMKFAKRTPPPTHTHTIIYMNPLSRIPGSARETAGIHRPSCSFIVGWINKIRFTCVEVH